MKCKGNELKRIFESYYQFLKQAEMQLMCDYCFGTLEKVWFAPHLYKIMRIELVKFVALFVAS